MSGISDELLMRYEDGELSPAERHMVETALAGDPDAMRRLDVFRLTGRRLGESLAAELNRPVPKHLIDAIMSAPMVNGTRVRASSSRRPAARANNGLLSWIWPVEGWPMPLVAACALSLSAVVGLSWALYGARERNATAELLVSESGRKEARGALARALEGTGSGTIVTASTEGQDVAIKPVLSFVAHDRSFCRKYEIEAESGSLEAGLACREDGGRWRVVIHSAATGSASGTERIAPAAGPEQNGAIEAAIDRLIDGNALTRAREDELMRSSWRQ